MDKVAKRKLVQKITAESPQKTSWIKSHFVLNKRLLPLKLTLFFFSASAFSILPYLTIHMSDIGIKVEHIAIMYAVLPFAIFMAPPLVGFMADKLGKTEIHSFEFCLMCNINKWCTFFKVLTLGFSS